MKTTLALIITIVAAASVWVYGATLVDPRDPPAILPYRGFLQKDDVPVSGNVKMVVTLYSDPSPSPAPWFDTFDVSVSAGQFSVELGKGKALPPSLFTSGRPVEIGVAVLDDENLRHELVGRQRIHPVAYAVSAANANHSTGDFTVGGKLTVSGVATLGRDSGDSGTRTLFFDHGADHANAGSLQYRPPSNPGALVITGAGLSGDSLRKVQVNNQLTVDHLTVNNDATANRFKPQFDSGWFFVHRGSGDLFIPHDLNGFPSHFMLLQCGAFEPSGIKPDPLPTLSSPKRDADCKSRVVVSSVGYKDDGGFINPDPITANGTNFLIPVVWKWWVWGYWTNGNPGGWQCPIDDDNDCFTGYYRILAWR